MGVSRSNSGGSRCRMVLIVVWVFGLVGCQTQPTLEAPQKWSKGSNGGYTNNATGQVISRNEYGKLVAAESYYSLLSRDPGRPYCQL